MNEVAIVTGGARGIGKAIVKKLAEKKITVIEKEAIDLKEEFEKKNIKIEIIKADVSQKDECIKLVNYVLNKYGKIDILINNAGISKVQLIDEVTVKDWNEMINTNLYSAFCMCQLVIPGMIKRKKGNIINISSIWGIVGASQEILYSITKAGMNGLTKGLAKEVGPSNIRVNSIAPGCIDTDMNKELTKEDINQIIDETPLERIGKPEDIAECVEWLIKDNFTTGQVISINGGWYIT